MPFLDGRGPAGGGPGFGGGRGYRRGLGNGPQARRGFGQGGNRGMGRGGRGLGLCMAGVTGAKELLEQKASRLERILGAIRQRIAQM